jgi:3-oxoacyl-[acyl-carrier protein] reductase
VTGSGRPLGRAISLQLAAAGALVVCTELDERDAVPVAAECGNGSWAAHVGVAHPEECRTLIEAVTQRHERLDIVVSAAVDVKEDGHLADLLDEVWARALSISLSGHLHMARAAESIMRRQGHGRLINIAVAPPNSSTEAYGIATVESGTATLTQRIARELGQARDITVNAICASSSRSAQSISIRRPTVAGVASLAAFLASDEARSINGQVIHVG